MPNFHPMPPDCREPWCPYIDECPDTCSRIKSMLAAQPTDIDYESFITCDVMTMGR